MALGCAVVLASCAPRPATIVRAPIAQPQPPPPVIAAPVSPWPVPLRVVAWLPDGVRTLGELPGYDLAQLPAGAAWYVEPTRELSTEELAQTIAAVRSEQVPGLSLRGQPVARWAAALRDLPALTALLVDDTGVDGATLAALELPLQRLYAARTGLDDTSLAAVVARNPQLAVLDIEDCAVGDAGLRAVAGLRTLRALSAAGTRVTDAGGGVLRGARALEILDLGRTAVGARTVAAIRELALRELFLDGTRVGKELSTLAGFAPGLRRFDASNLASRHAPTDAEVGWLARAPQLIEVGLSRSRVTDRLALALAAGPALARIRLAEAPITLATARALAARRGLVEVDLAGTPVDDAAAAALLAGATLEVLRLDATAVSDAALLGVVSPVLGELYLSKTAVTDAGLVVLDRAPALVALGLGETAVGDPTLARVARLTQLRRLVLTKVDAGAHALAGLAALGDLHALYLESTRTDDAVLAALASLTRLRALHVASTSLTDAALPTLRGFTRLEELTLGATGISSALVATLPWPQLTALSVSGLGIDDAALARLTQLRALVTLDLSATDVHDLAPLLSLRDLRTLGIVGLTLARGGPATLAALRRRGVEVVR